MQGFLRVFLDFPAPIIPRIGLLLLILLCFWYFAGDTNLHGDIVGIVDSSGTEVVKYTYDAWGKVLSTTGSLVSTLGAIQLFRQVKTLGIIRFFFRRQIAKN